MRDWFLVVVLIVGGIITGFGIALLIWPPVELDFIDGEMTKVMICKMSTKRFVIRASCADLEEVIEAARATKREDSSL